MDKWAILEEMERWSNIAELQTAPHYHVLLDRLKEYKKGTKEYNGLKKIKDVSVKIDGYIVDDLRNSIKEFKQIINKEES